MEKTFRMIGLALAAMVIMPLASCNDEEESVTPPSGENEIVNETGMRLIQVGDCSFGYDGQGRIESMWYDYSEGYKINWNKGVIEPLVSHEGFSGGLNFKTNGNGYVTDVSQSVTVKYDDSSYKANGKAKFSYDSSGHLTKINLESSESGVEDGEKFSCKGTARWIMTWEAGNLVAAHCQEEFFEDGVKSGCEYNYSIEYGRNENKYKQWSHSLLEGVLDFELSELGHIGLFGVGTSNFPVCVAIEVMEGEEYFNYDYSVNILTNSEDLISLEETDYETYDYIYEGVDDSIRSFLVAKSEQLERKHKSLFRWRHIPIK